MTSRNITNVIPLPSVIRPLEIQDVRWEYAVDPTDEGDRYDSINPENRRRTVVRPPGDNVDGTVVFHVLSQSRVKVSMVSRQRVPPA